MVLNSPSELFIQRPQDIQTVVLPNDKALQNTNKGAPLFRLHVRCLTPWGRHAVNIGIISWMPCWQAVEDRNSPVGLSLLLRSPFWAGIVNGLQQHDTLAGIYGHLELRECPNKCHNTQENRLVPRMRRTTAINTNEMLRTPHQ